MKYNVIYINHDVDVSPRLCKEVFNTEEDALEFIAALSSPSYLVTTLDACVPTYHD